MGTHGVNQQQNVIAVIPARYSSRRLEGKLLLPINGKPMIIYTLRQAELASNVDRVIVATDDERILQAVEESGGEGIMTKRDHQSGSDRIAEVAEFFADGTLIVNVQGDEPLISPFVIEKAVAEFLNDSSIDISTTCESVESYKDVLNPDVVKVVTDKDGNALYFSRSPIPFPREAVAAHGSLEKALKKSSGLLSFYRKHTGLYVYRKEFLLKYHGERKTSLEEIEFLEQLRALENGAKIKVIDVEQVSVGVDTIDDFERVKTIIEKRDLANGVL